MALSGPHSRSRSGRALTANRHLMYFKFLGKTKTGTAAKFVAVPVYCHSYVPHVTVLPLVSAALPQAATTPKINFNSYSLAKISLY